MTTYQDIQNRKPVWILAIVVFVAGLIWWGFIQQIFLGQPWGTNPSPDWLMWVLVVLVGIGLPLFFFTMRLVVTVGDDMLHIQIRPVFSRKIAYNNIKSVTARSYNPLFEYGGWGIRYRPGKRAYSMSGTHGVELELVDGQTVMIGTNAPDPLAAAIKQKLV